MVYLDERNERARVFLFFFHGNVTQITTNGPNYSPPPPRRSTSFDAPRLRCESKDDDRGCPRPVGIITSAELYRAQKCMGCT